MKKVLTLLLCCLSMAAMANNRTFSKLTEVNKQWLTQSDVCPDILPNYKTQSEKEWIRTHLMLVETTLRKRSVSGLSVQQRRNRAECLDYLHQYWQTGNFPINEDYTYRTPIFIDKYNNFCAVGHLIKESGNEQISGMIAAKTNLAYVPEMEYPELAKWATEYGFTADELAWIQPGYPYSSTVAKVGNGVNGSINELYSDYGGDTLYVGGAFTEVDGSIATENVAYVTEAGGIFTWHKMGAGVNGAVNAITKYDGLVFVGGSFDMAGGVAASNIAYWDGAAWHAAGCVIGEVRDLIIFNGALYACGDFDDCSTTSEANFARWNGTDWIAIPGIVGRINVMRTVSDTILVMGGAFTYDTAINIIKWQPVISFASFPNNIRNEVMDINNQTGGGSLYVSCKRTDATDPNLMWGTHNINNNWDTSYFDCAPLSSSLSPAGGQLSINTIFPVLSSCPDFGGNFTLAGTSGGSTSYFYTPGSAYVDSTVNKILFFKFFMIIAGSFRSGNSNSSPESVVLNGIAHLKSNLDVKAISDNERHTVSVSPNPTVSGGIVTIHNNFSANKYHLSDMAGRVILLGELNNAQQATLPQLAQGLYIITVTNNAGSRMMQKIVVE